ncbi:MAG: 2-phospho-L-lactate transferase [Thermomicrobiales bacterium]
MIVALAGGVGGAKMAQGLDLALSPGELTVVVNTADDFELYGLRISPDIDTVLYTLAGLANPVTGWGIGGDTRHTLDAMARLGEEAWFLLGDQDLATHILRTERLRGGASLSEITADFGQALGLTACLLPMTDDPVATLVETPDGILSFQDYFVRRRQTDDVLGVRFAGIEQARPGPAVLDAITAADLIVICPSNPIVSVGPILSLPWIRPALDETNAPVLAVSPIVGGRAIKGPADKMMATLGREVSAYGIAELYAGLIDGIVVDGEDRTLLSRIEGLGMRAIATQTIMGDAGDRRRLAAEVIAFGRSLAPVGVTP